MDSSFSVLDVFELEPKASKKFPFLTTALQVISKLHRLPRGARVPVLVNARLRAQGHYSFLNTVPNKPLSIALSPRASHPCLTLAHEIGHFLDNQMLHALKQEFASSYDEDFSPLRLAWEQTEMVRHLRHLLSRYASRMRPSDRIYIMEVLSPQELWACTYAQWVATQSADELFLRELRREIEPSGVIAGIPYSTQWVPADFKSIMEPVHSLFGKRGLL